MNKQSLSTCNLSVMERTQLLYRGKHSALMGKFRQVMSTSELSSIQAHITSLKYHMYNK